MNRDLLDALGAIAAEFYWDSLDRYPCLFRDPRERADNEAILVWQVLMVIDELAIAVQAAKEFDHHPVEDDSQERLPF